MQQYRKWNPRKGPNGPTSCDCEELNYITKHRWKAVALLLAVLTREFAKGSLTTIRATNEYSVVLHSFAARRMNGFGVLPYLSSR